MATAAPPQTRKQEVTDTHHGVRVTEHYRWLEDAKNPAVKKWSAAQNAQTRQYLDKLPNVKAVRARVREILAAKTVSFSSVAYRGGRLFAIKRQPPRHICWYANIPIC